MEEYTVEEYIVKVHADGTQHWRQNDKLHRIDGPAIIGANGYKAWYQNGKPHRLNGPATIFADGGKSWYQNDKLHRIDGPAVEWIDGGKEWHIEGKEYTEEQFNQKLNNYDDKVVTIDGKEYTLKLK